MFALFREQDVFQNSNLEEGFICFKKDLMLVWYEPTSQIHREAYLAYKIWDDYGVVLKDRYTGTTSIKDHEFINWLNEERPEWRI